MILKHQHISRQLHNQKDEHILNQQNPLLLISSTKFTFMNNFIKRTLKYEGVAFIQKQIESFSLMGDNLPAIYFNDVVLCEVKLVEFLTDVGLSSLEYQQYLQRKYWIIRVYTEWNKIIRRIINNQSINDIIMYQNQVFEELNYVSVSTYGKMLQRYCNYKSEQMNLENLLVTDIVNSILIFCPKTIPDHLLRGYKSQLIQFVQNWEHTHPLPQIGFQYDQRKQNLNILLDKVKPTKQKNLALVTLNWKSFSLSFLALIVIYIKYVK